MADGYRPEAANDDRQLLGFMIRIVPKSGFAL
jgi:hypothetical protein